MLRASGPLQGGARRRGFLIITAEDRAAVEAIVAADPFAEAGLIDILTIEAWDPLFGVFQAEATGSLEALLARGSRAPG